MEQSGMNKPWKECFRSEASEQSGIGSDAACAKMSLPPLCGELRPGCLSSKL